MERKEVEVKAQAAKVAEIIQTVAVAAAPASVPLMDEPITVRSWIKVFTMHQWLHRI